MRRWLISAAIIILLAGGAFALWRITGPRDQPVPSVPKGDYELAWIHAATSVSAWERFVTGVNRVSRDWPELQVNDANAFPESTTATPEIILSLSGQPRRVFIRWYKLSKGASAAEWMARLAKRTQPPLVVIGGGSSDRAVDLAKALANQKTWQGVSPLLFITTATASAITDPDSQLPVDLMDVYPGRSFRMCFTNAQIAQAVVDFVWSQADLRPNGDPNPTFAVIGAAAAMNPVTLLPILSVQAEAGAPSVSGLEWDDDPYSIDLSKQFHRVFHESRFGSVIWRERWSIPFSVGPQYAPNDWEAQAVDHLLASLTVSPLERQLLVLPTLAAPARRVLRSITGALPLIGRNLVAITGDSINLNNVYRDADVGWNIRIVPVPLVFFAHQNPVEWDWAAADEDRVWPPGTAVRQPAQPVSTADGSPSALAPPTNTDEVLLHRDMIRMICRAIFEPADQPIDADELRLRLRRLNPPVFDDAGDRLGGQGEYVLCLRPQFFDPGHPLFSQVLGTATLEVWTRDRATWRPVKRLILDHGRANRTHF